MVRGQAELLLEAGGEATGGVVAAGEGNLQRSEGLLQQGEGMTHAHLGQQLTKAASFAGQLAYQRGAAHGEVGGNPLQGMGGAGLHAEIAGQPLPQRHGAGRIEQIEGPGGVQFGIKAL